MTKTRAPENGRELVRSYASQQWREQASVIYFRRRAVGYEVPGRTADGGVSADESLVSKALKILIVVPFGIVMIPFTIVFGALADLGIDIFGWASDFGKVSVAGGRDCAALWLADAVRDLPKDTDLWLVWSNSRMVVIQGNDASAPRIVWEADSRYRPKLKAATTKLTWADGSTVTLEIGKAEREHVSQSRGKP